VPVDHRFVASWHNLLKRKTGNNVNQMQMSASIDKANQEFWDELCGSAFALCLGIKDRSRESLMKFDQAYLQFYPYLLTHVKVGEMSSKKIMEVGLGYGTLGQKIVEAGADYIGLDIAKTPVRMMNYRLLIMGLRGSAIQGNILDCPFDSESLDWVVSIGCYHHTGDIQRCIDETYRVLKPGGKATIMVYNRFSYRQWFLWPRQTLQALLSDLGLLRNYPTVSEEMRKFYDSNLSGIAAPETEFSSIRKLRKLFGKFSRVKFYKENCDNLYLLKLVSKPVFLKFISTKSEYIMVPRLKLLSSLGRTLGTDIYVETRK